MDITKKLMKDLEVSWDPNQREIGDNEWKRKSKDWDRLKAQWMKEMVNSSIWGDALTDNDLEKDAKELPDDDGEDGDYQLNISDMGFRLPTKPTAVPSIRKTKSVLNQISTQGTTKSSAPTQKIKGTPTRMTRKQLWRYLNNWDQEITEIFLSFLAPPLRRDRIICDFVKTYTWKYPLDTNDLFACGASLIFVRFTVGMQMAYMKTRKVGHYFKALAIFVRSINGSSYTVEYVSMGALSQIFDIIRESETNDVDKACSLMFLLELMKSENGAGVKHYVCDNPTYLDLLQDFLIECTDADIVDCCREIFESLCVENSLTNVNIVSDTVVALLPCNFNPVIQALSFRVMQSIVLQNEEMGPVCFQYILENLDTEDCKLVIEIGQLCKVIISTKEGDRLIDLLMNAGSGLKLKEDFITLDRTGTINRGKSNGRKLVDKVLQEQLDKARARRDEKDMYHQQAGAIFLINQMIRDDITIVDRFVQHGALGLSLKALGAVPHWEVQVQAVQLMELLYQLSFDCSISYNMILPPKMIDLILDKPNECLQYISSSVCLTIRKLGRLCLVKWKDWLEKALNPIKRLPRKQDINARMFTLNTMTRKVAEMYKQIETNLASPLTEGTAQYDSDTETDSDLDEFYDSDGEKISPPISSGDPNLVGTKFIYRDKNLREFRQYMNAERKVSLDYSGQPDGQLEELISRAHFPLDDQVDKDLGGIELAMLQDAEKASVKLNTSTLNEQDNGSLMKDENLEEEEDNKEDEDEEFNVEGSIDTGVISF